jgi:hypothetical protein
VQLPYLYNFTVSVQSATATSLNVFTPERMFSSRQSVFLGPTGTISVQTQAAIRLEMQSLNGGSLVAQAERGVVKLEDVYANSNIAIGTAYHPECDFTGLNSRMNRNSSSAAFNGSIGAQISDICSTRGGEVYISATADRYPHELGHFVRLNATEPSGVICAAAPARSELFAGSSTCGLPENTASMPASGLKCDMLVDLCDVAVTSNNATQVNALSCGTGIFDQPTHSHAISVTRGGVYISMFNPNISSVTGYAVSDGGAFAAGVQLDPATRRALQSLQAWIDAEPSSDALISVDLEEQNAGKWLFSTKDVYLQLQPQWIAPFSCVWIRQKKTFFY